MVLDKDFNLCVGLRIREIREAQQLSREKFSEKCDLSDSFLSAVESGKKGITSKTIYKICSANHISADYLIFGKEHGFETDTVVELIESLDKPSRESALRILTEYYNAIMAIQHKKQKSNTEPPAE